jgi:flagellar biosynthesis protein FlhG
MTRLVPLDPARRRVVAVTGGKGGVGKSSVAVNLAVSWARRGARTLALDGDMGMADLNLLLGLAPGRSLMDLIGGCPVEEVLIAAHGIHFLPALSGG